MKNSVFPRTARVFFPARHIVLAVFLALAPLVRAQTFTWSTTAATGNMTSGTNWSGGNAPAASGNAISFTTSTTGNVVNDFSSLSVTGITLQGNATQFTISGNPITLAGGISVSGTMTIPVISAELIMSGTQTISTPNGASLTISGVISGSGGITKTAGGAGVLLLTGANTFSGGFQQNNGTVRLAGAGTLGSSSGSVNISGGTLDLNGTSQTVGLFNGGGTVHNNATGTASTLTIGNGDANGGGFSGTLADNSSGTGTVALVKTGSGTQVLSGASTYSGGTTVNAGTLQLGTEANQALGTGAVTVNSGGTLHLDRNTLANNLTLNGGTLAGDNGFGDILNGTVSLTATSTVSNEYSMALTNTVSGAGGLTKVNSGTLTLSGANTYTGATSVTAGTLLVNGSLADTTVTVSSGATLGGGGTLGGPTTIESGATLAPGNSPGLLTFDSTLTLNSGSTSIFEIDGTDRGSTYDAVDVTGLTTLAGTLALNFGSMIADGTTLGLFGFNSGSTGSFFSVTAEGAYAGIFANNAGTWTLTIGDQTLTFSQSTGDLSFAAAVPEPGTYAVIVAALALGAAFVLRRHRLV